MPASDGDLGSVEVLESVPGESGLDIGLGSDVGDWVVCLESGISWATVGLSWVTVFVSLVSSTSLILEQEESDEFFFLRNEFEFILQ